MSRVQEIQVEEISIRTWLKRKIMNLSPRRRFTLKDLAVEWGPLVGYNVSSEQGTYVRDGDKTYLLANSSLVNLTNHIQHAITLVDDTDGARVWYHNCAAQATVWFHRDYGNYDECMRFGAYLDGQGDELKHEAQLVYAHARKKFNRSKRVKKIRAA